MPVIFFKSYKILDTQGKEIFFTDFLSPLRVKSDIFSILKNDLTSVSDLNLKFAVQTYLLISLTIGSKIINIEIEKDYYKKTLKISTDGRTLEQDLFTFIEQNAGIKYKKHTLLENFFDISAKSFIKEEEAANLISNVQSHIEILDIGKNSTFEKEIAELTSKISLEKRGKIVKDANAIFDLDLRKVLLEKGIDLYQNGKKNMESKAAEKKQIENDIETIDQKIQSVANLLTKKEEIEKKLAKVNFPGNKTDLKAQITNLKSKRIDNVINYLKNIKAKVQNKMQVEDWKDPIDEKIQSINNQIIIFLILFLLQGAFSIFTFTISKDSNSWYIGLIIMLVLIFYLIIYNLQSKPFKKLKILNRNENFFAGLTGNSREDKFFVDYAFMNAYLAEKNIVEESIKRNLGESNYLELRKQRSRLENLLAGLKKEETEILENTYSADEYYKKRRELDILKIERENIELGLLPEESSIVSSIVSLLKQKEGIQDLQKTGLDAIKSYPVVLNGALKLTANSLAILQTVIANLKNQKQVILIDLLI